ncbi:hypothetical protein WR25_18948 [Diploscapter pachys]|uniref:Spaetzle domain-containing protein n=1 Tax=Diploscapter pachys TaxID=2018661 RepID=A0A2A2K9A9_9BILA|nr:hypothetical protein WR25_18948 [Diploscapter pachys]
MATNFHPLYGILTILLLKLHYCSMMKTIDLEHISVGELKRMQSYLSDQLKKVEEAIERTRRKRATSPLSASLPNRESTYFLNRIGALKQSLQEKEKSREPKTTSNIVNTTGESIDSRPNNSKFDGQLPASINDTLNECKQLTQPELVAELKQKGTYNPELMAWDAIGVIRFLDRTIHDNYQRQPQSRNKQQTEEVVERNVEALANLMKELNVSCDVKTPAIRARLQNITFSEPRRSILSPSIRRMKRMDEVEEIFAWLNSTDFSHTNFDRLHDQPLTVEDDRNAPRQKLIGESHIVPFGCDKRGAEEDGYLRLCGACQAIRKLPDTFFPPFINEVTCDTDKACLYFYDYPHGKCRQKHMNFVVLRNIGTKNCQIWKKFNLNVRVSCECFVDEMSFFAKYV